LPHGGLWKRLETNWERKMERNLGTQTLS
jgi:hypothetical protein